MRFHEVRSVEIEAPYDEVFTFIADPHHLPEWAKAFEQVTGSRARLRTPLGTADIDLVVRSSREHGTVDWLMTFADGSIATAMSRVTEGSAGRTVYTFVLNSPPLPLEQIEGAWPNKPQRWKRNSGSSGSGWQDDDARRSAGKVGRVRLCR